MAEGSSTCNVSQETFHNIETKCDDAVPGKLVLLLKITQPGGRPLPTGVITERSIMALVKEVTNNEPLGVTIMTSSDTVLEFGQGARMFEISHNVNSWNKYKVEMGTIMSSKTQVESLIKERENI